MASATVIAVLLILLSVECVELNSWKRASISCLLDDAAFHKSAAYNEVQCAILGSARCSVGALVAQFNQVTQKCSLFLFQSVCRQMVASQMSECRVFLRFPVSPHSISSKLTGLWIADPISKLDNLVCQTDADTNRFNPVNVQWTNYGAQFNGVNAYLMLSKGNLGFDGGLTWLLRLKRQPKGQPYLAFFDCSSLNVGSSYNTEMWEWDAAQKAYTGVSQLRGLNSFSCYSAVILTSNPDEWIDIGFTSSPGSGSCDFYHNGSMVARSSITVSYPAQGSVFNKTCVYFGGKYNYFWFNGTLRAIGMANTTMTEAEMRQFFKLVT